MAGRQLLPILKRLFTMPEKAKSFNLCMRFLTLRTGFIGFVHLYWWASPLKFILYSYLKKDIIMRLNFHTTKEEVGPFRNDIQVLHWTPLRRTRNVARNTPSYLSSVPIRARLVRNVWSPAGRHLSKSDRMELTVDSIAGDEHTLADLTNKASHLAAMYEDAQENVVPSDCNDDELDAAVEAAHIGGLF
jgi:hypothetical protein